VSNKKRWLTWLRKRLFQAAWRLVCHGENCERRTAMASRLPERSEGSKKKKISGFFVLLEYSEGSASLTVLRMTKKYGQNDGEIRSERRELPSE
jgi:hypothetical protein